MPLLNEIICLSYANNLVDVSILFKKMSKYESNKSCLLNMAKAMIQLSSIILLFVNQSICSK